MIHGGRGGYCYEHNLIFSGVLRALGFRVTWLSARVLWNVPPGAVLPRTHIALLVDLNDESYLADVGFGGNTLRLPLRFVIGLEQQVAHESFRIVAAKDDFILQAKLQEGWLSLYRFDLREQFLADCEVANWYTSTHPRSIFTTKLLVARMDPTRRLTLFNNRLSVHGPDGATEQRLVESAAALRQVLTETFGISLPDAQELDARFEQFLQRVKEHQQAANHLGEFPGHAPAPMPPSSSAAGSRAELPRRGR